MSADKGKLDPRYYERRRWPKWNVQPNVLLARESRLTRAMFPELSKTDHERLAREFALKAGEERARQQHYLDKAIATYGDLPRGKTPTSGIYNDAFPERVKDRLRQYWRDINDYTDASVAHHAASGKRIAWRDSALRTLAGIQ